MIKYKDIGKTPFYTSLGSRLVKDLLGTGLMLNMLMQRLEPEKIGAFSKFDTFRKSQSDFSTVWKTYIKGFIEGDSLG